MSKLQLKPGRPSDAAPKAALLSDLRDEKAKQVRINFDIEADRHKALKLLAVQRDKSIADILRELIDRELGKGA